MKRKNYNLVEIALAIGILAIGMTTVVSLFPLGFQTTKAAIAENYSSQTGDSMLAYIARESYSDWTIVDDIPEAKPTSSLTNIANWTHAEGSIYIPSPGTADGIYGLKVTSGDNNTITDFTGEALLWKSPIQNIMVDGNRLDLDNDYDESAALHLEISWPIEKPYAQREKRTFYFELFNFNQ
jgi:hypothetical protein